MCKINHIVNTIIDRANDQKITVTNMKLQKLLYFLYKEYLQRTGERLFQQRFQPWVYGPVLPIVYYSYKKMGTKPINQYMVDDNDDIRIVSEKGNHLFWLIFDRVWQRYKNYTGIQLSKITHDKRSAWATAMLNKYEYILDSDIKAEPDLLSKG